MNAEGRGKGATSGWRSGPISPSQAVWSISRAAAARYAFVAHRFVQRRGAQAAPGLLAGLARAGISVRSDRLEALLAPAAPRPAK
jgi:hypothetical protein